MIHQHLESSLSVLSMDQDIQVTVAPHRWVPVCLDRQSRPLEGHSLDTGTGKVVEDRNEVPGHLQVPDGIFEKKCPDCRKFIGGCKASHFPFHPLVQERDNTVPDCPILSPPGGIIP